MSEFRFYLQVLSALERTGVAYMVVGAFAAGAYGLARSTHDIDVVVDLDPVTCTALAAQFPAPRYYADAQQMIDSIELGIMFNIIDTSLGVKADLVPLSQEPAYRLSFARRTRCQVVDADGQVHDIWCARPEDLILGKLEAWQQGRSAKHPADVFVVLVFLLSGLGQREIDTAYVTRQVPAIGAEAAALWDDVLARAEAEVARRSPPF